MNIPVEAFIIAAAMLGGSIGFLGAAWLINSKHRSQYNRGWNAGREFARNHPDLL